jgi:D-alanyl-D-alanine carboxypeptidase
MRELRVWAVAAIASIVLLVGAAGAQASARTDRADAALNRGLHALVSTPKGPPGAYAQVQRGSQRKTFNQGEADLDTNAKIKPDDAWRIASVSKAFNGATALALVQQGQLSLDDTIAQRLPELPAAWGQVTLREALQHTSGLPDFVGSQQFIDELTNEPRAPVAPTTLLSYVADQPLDFPPGTQYHYSDSDNVVVGLMIEQATGLPYQQAMSSLVIDPLDLGNTMLATGWTLPTPFVHGYEGGKDDVSQVLNASIAGASGGMIATPPDLARFVRAYAGGKLISGATRAAQFSFVPGSSGPPGPGANGAGLAIFRYRTRCGTVYGHTGNFPGYTTFIGATADGRRSATVQVSAQIAPEFTARLFPPLRRTFALAVCAALAR